MKIKIFYEPIYNTHLLLLYECNYIEAEHYFSKNKIRTDLIKCSGQTGTYRVEKPDGSSQKRYYIYIEKTDKGWIEDISTILHEISHLVFMSLFDCGIEINPKTDETFSYYFEWWFKTLINSLTPKKRAKRKKRRN
ncbi:MAG: hypothetical protein NT155_03645 [Candidatus Staskawiczbacteria bacterium]|nr:hypothetical protein [Candidatus Staskawiczbacteria bacterium]